MAIRREHLRQHLELALQAYGSDLALPPGQALAPRPAVTTPAATASTANPAAGPDAPGPAPAVRAGPARPAGSAPPSAAAAKPASPTMPPTAAAAALAELRAEVMPCRRCKLCEGRNTVVFGEGDPSAPVMFVGEAPGAVEDQTGRPFVGASGQLLDRILANAMGLRREQVYIANINKCRPPGNREPAPDEVAACLPFLRRQVDIVRPSVIVCLGRVAAQNLLGTTESAGALRGRTLDYAGIPVVVTWHPSYLLRDPSHKRETWDDIKRVNRLLGRPEVPPPAAGQPPQS